MAANYRGGTASMAWGKYDKLPHSVKLALQEARIPWGPGWFYRQFESGKMSAPAIVKYIKKVDRAEAIKAARKAWGPDYPIELIR